MGGADKEKKAKVAERNEEGESPTANPELVESMGKLQDIQDELETVRIMLLVLIQNIQDELETPRIMLSVLIQDIQDEPVLSISYVNYYRVTNSCFAYIYDSHFNLSSEILC
jgi:hypothetical protein